MRWRPFILGLAMAWFGLSSPAWAILIKENSPSAVPFGGYFVSQDEKTVKIKFLLDGKEQSKEYELSKFEILYKIDTARLKKLDKSDAKAYYDYAEELADKKLADDPEAKDIARHLFLIAAYLDKRQFGQSALLSMSSLAHTPPAEAQRFRAMAFVLDPKGDDDALKLAPTPKPPTSALQDFEKALQSYRTGQIASAKLLANTKDMDMVFSKAAGGIDKTTFLQWCTDAEAQTGNPPEDRMRRTLRAELWVIDQLPHGDAGDKTNAGETKWSSILQARQIKPVSPLSLETIADDIDPRKCVYRDGKWVVP